jgi:hypothetical protein
MSTDSTTPSRAAATSLAWPGAATVREGRIVVTGTAGTGRLQEVAAATRRAVTRVRQVWGDTVLRGRVLVEVPATDAQFRARGGSAEAGAQLAATTTPDGSVVLAPSLFRTLTPEGRVVVLTHELTHVALHQAALTAVAHWIVEGSAEFTAYHASTLSAAQLSPQVAAAVRAGHGPAGPPADANFAARPAAAYQEAYVWCRFLAQRFGLPRFVAFVRSADARQPGAFSREFGTTIPALSAPYAHFLRSKFGPVAAPS